MRHPRIQDIAGVFHGGTPRKQIAEYWIGDIPWVSPKDVKADSLSDAADHISNKAIENSATRLVPAGSILAVARSGVLAHSFPVTIVEKPMAFNQDIKALVPNRELILPEYLFYFLRQRENEVVSRGVKKGATVHSLQSAYLENLEVPLPALRDQQRVIDILKRADGLRRLLKQAQDTARQLIPALFVDMFGDPMANQNQWHVVPLKEVASIGSGVTKGRKLKDVETVELPYLRVANVQDGHLDLSTMKTITIKKTEIEKYSVLPGDFLMTEGGDPDKLGRGAIWTGAVAPCLHQNHVFRVRCDRSKLTPEYLRSLVSSLYGKAYFLRVAKQTTGIASINKTQLGDFPVQLPPLAHQVEFLEKLAGVQSVIEQQEKASAVSDSTFQALLHQAFPGNS